MGVLGHRREAAVVGRLLKEKGLWLGVAESCTGGILSSWITDIPGSSAYFRGGVVAYDNSVKSGVIGVLSSTLERRGAVSAETAGEMADGVRRSLGADIGVAITGIAGPGGGSARRPVGTVYICVAGKKGAAKVRKFFFKGTRHQVRRQSAFAALQMIEAMLNG